MVRQKVYTYEPTKYNKQKMLAPMFFSGETKERIKELKSKGYSGGKIKFTAYRDF